MTPDWKHHFKMTLHFWVNHGQIDAKEAEFLENSSEEVQKEWMNWVLEQEAKAEMEAEELGNNAEPIRNLPEDDPREVR